MTNPSQFQDSEPGRILALDVGMRRIGMAVSDPLGITAQGIPTLQRRNLRSDLARLCEIARDKQVGRIVVGYPLHLSGEEGRQAAIVREFASRLAERSGLPVGLWDERLTTVEANRILREAGGSHQKRAKAVDKLSAVLILQNYLDAMPETSPWPGAG
jgi:putative Holliday junction resolvase